MGHICYVLFVFAMLSCLFVTCWERADLLARLYVKFSCFFVTFPCDVLGQVWNLIVLIPDICLLTYCVHYTFLKLHYSSHKMKYINYQAVRAIQYNSKLFLCYCKIIGNFNSNLIWRTISRLVDEAIPLDHPRIFASRVIRWYDLIHSA